MSGAEGCTPAPGSIWRVRYYRPGWQLGREASKIRYFSRGYHAHKFADKLRDREATEAGSMIAEVSVASRSPWQEVDR